MRRLYTLLSILLLCTTVAMAQAKIEFDSMSKEVGYVLWRVPVTVSYNFTNTGNKPLVLSNVTTSCGCMTAEWTKTPVAPGAGGVIKVTFDAEAIGHFYKDVGIYCNASYEPIYLDFNGEVTADSKNYMFTHIYAFGAIRLNKKEINFSDVRKGEEPTVEILVANTSNKAYTPILMHLPPYLEMKAEPAVLQRGDAGKIVLTLHSDKMAAYGTNNTCVYVSRYMGDKVCDANAVSLKVLLLPGKEEMNLQQHSSIALSQLKVDFQALKGSQKKSQTIMVTNQGKSELEIRRIELSGPALAASIKQHRINPGEMVKMKITLNAKYLQEGKNSQQLMLITNDPEHSKVIIPVTGNKI